MIRGQLLHADALGYFIYTYGAIATHFIIVAFFLISAFRGSSLGL